MTRNVLFAFLAVSAASLTGASAAFARPHDLEPKLSFAAPAGPPSIALTFDACSGAFDKRIADLLVQDRIPATIFVTHRWLRRNPDGLALLLAHPDLFEIEDHGDHHVPAITDEPVVFGLKTAGTLDAVKAEVDGGAAAVLAATGTPPHWFRGATARYSRDAMQAIESEGYRLAGYSLNADMGAALPEKTVARRLAGARSGDVVIAHINQPTHSAGAGVVDGIKALEAAGFRFVRLDAVSAVPGS